MREDFLENVEGALGLLGAGKMAHFDPGGLSRVLVPALLRERLLLRLLYSEVVNFLVAVVT